MQVQVQNDRSSTQVLELLEMPLDILFEISQYLHPIDILSLGRTSRVTHQLVRSPEFKPVWVHARSQYPGLPDCPRDMTEPAYAELMFGDSCLVCGKLCAIDHMRHIFEAHDRLCVDCFPSRYTFSEDCKLASRLPAKIVKLLPTYSEYRSNGGCLAYTIKFYSDFHLSSWLKQYENAKDQQKWEDAMMHQQENVTKHVPLCQSFHYRWREEVIQDRKNVLFGHMEELGYSDEMRRYEKVIYEREWDFRQLCQKPLTAKALEDMASEIEGFMQLIKNKSLEMAYRYRLRTLEEAYKEALHCHPPEQPYLRVSDLLLIPRIWSIVTETPSEVHVEKDLFNISSETLADITAEATSIIHARLISLAEVGLPHKAFDPTTVLASATTVFRSKKYNPALRDFFFAPEALSEPNASLDPQDMAMKEHAMLYNLAHILLRSLPWGTDNSVTFDRRLHDLLCDILAICGLDPTTTLLSHLEDEPPIVDCTECSTVDSGRLLMSWSWAAYHISNSHPGSSLIPSQRFRRVVGNEVVEARLAFKQALIERYISLDRPVSTRCTYCNHTANMMPEMVNHLLENHDIPSIRPTDFEYKYDPTEHFLRTRYMQEYRMPPSTTQ